MKKRTSFYKLVGLFALVLMLGFSQQAFAVAGVVQSQTDLAASQGYGLGTKYQFLLKLTVTPNGLTTGDIINSFTFDIIGSAEISRISILRASFLDLNNRFGTAVDNPGATGVTISGGFTFTSATTAQTLYVVLDIKPTATIGNTIDVNCTNANVTVAGVVTNFTPAAPSTDRSAVVAANWTGTKTIKNAGGDFTTLNAAAVAFNNYGVQPDALGSGGVTFILDDDASYTGVSGTTGGGFATASNLVRQTGTVANPIIFKRSGTGTNRPIVTTANSSATMDACIGGYGVDYMTVDGIDFRVTGVTSGTGGANRFEFGVIFMAVYDDGCSYNEVKNCKIDLANTVSNKRGAGVMILARDGATNSAGTNNYNKIHDNLISNVDGGVSINASQPGTAPLVWDTGNEIYNNTITGNFGAEQGGIGIGYTQDTKIYNNTLDGTGSTLSLNGAVMAIQTTFYPNYGYVNCYNNIIKNYSNLSTGTSATVVGIKINAPTVRLYNNVITNLKAENSTGTGGTSAGIILGSHATVAPDMNVWHNTVYISQASPSTGTRVAALAFDGGGGNLVSYKLINNMFVNNSTGGGSNVGTGGTNNFVLYAQFLAKSKIDATSDNNLYYPESASMFSFASYANNYANLTAYKTAMATIEQNSVTGDPLFVNTATNDLSITNATSPAINSGKTVASVTTDIAGTSRAATPADLGAYESNLNSTTSDYFRSKATGNWADLTSWKSSTDNSTWMNASLAPTSSSAAINVLTGHEITVAAAATASTLTVNAGGKLTLNSGITLSAANFNLKSSATDSTTATFKDLDGTLSVSGTTNVEQYLTTGRNWYVSSPVGAATSNVFAADVTNPLYYYVENTPNVWSQITNTTTDLTAGTGYIANITSDRVVTFTGGTLNTAKSITGLTSTGTSFTGYNLVGNPYPSYYDWNNATKTNVGTSIWYRSKSTGAYLFQTYNSDGGAYTNGGSNLIPPMQAFWVKVASGQTGSIDLPNVNRSHQDQSLAANRLKAPAQLDARKQLRLEVSNGVIADEALIYANANAQDGFDTYDSNKMFGNNAEVPEIYTVLGNEKLAINGVNDFAENQQMALGFKTTAANTFSIKASEVKNFAADTKIILIDHLMPGQEFDLTDGAAYSFTSEVANDVSRFSVIFRAPGGTTGVSKTEKMNAQVFVNTANQLSILAPSSCNYAVYNLVGQKVANGRTTATQTTANLQLQSGVYVVKVTENGRNFTSKVLVN